MRKNHEYDESGMMYIDILELQAENKKEFKY